jgi:hypothetical protein
MKKLSVLFLVIYTFARVASAQSERLPPLNVKQYKLKNGLTVVLSRDTSASMVSVNIWYKVGSRNETAGRTGKIKFLRIAGKMVRSLSKTVRNLADLVRSLIKTVRESMHDAFVSRLCILNCELCI